MHRAGTNCRFDEEQFTESLGRLKRAGCNLLVVGPVPDSVRLSAMSRFLGEPTADRRRLVVVTEGTRTGSRGCCRRTATTLSSTTRRACAPRRRSR
jgi:hypothetical protein